MFPMDTLGESTSNSDSRKFKSRNGGFGFYCRFRLMWLSFPACFLSSVWASYIPCSPVPTGWPHHLWVCVGLVPRCCLEESVMRKFVSSIKSDAYQMGILRKNNGKCTVSLVEQSELWYCEWFLRFPSDVRLGVILAILIINGLMPGIC